MNAISVALFVPLLLSGCFRGVEIRDRSGTPVSDALVISTRGTAYFNAGACYASLSDANGKAKVQECCLIFVLKRGYLPIRGDWGAALILDEAPDAISAYEMHEHRLCCPASDTYSKVDSPVPGLVVEARVSTRPSRENLQAPLDHDLPIGAVEIEYRVSSLKGKLYQHARFYGKLGDSEISDPVSVLEMKGNSAFVFSEGGKHYKMFLTNSGTPDHGGPSFSTLLFADIPSARTPLYPKDLIPYKLDEFTTVAEYYKGPLEPAVAMDRYNSVISSVKGIQKEVSPRQPPAKPAPK